MGYFKTLHFFDLEKFQKEVVPLLRGESEHLKSNYLNFQENYLSGGLSKFNKKEINTRTEYGVEMISKIGNELFTSKMDALVEKYKAFDFIYEFNAFFEYLIFQLAADFYPYCVLGKQNIMRHLETEHQSISSEILQKLEGENTQHFFCSPDHLGVIGWISNEDIQLLMLDQKNHSISSDFAQGIFQFLKFAGNQNLGIILGADLRFGFRMESFRTHKLLDQQKLETLRKLNKYIFQEE